MSVRVKICGITNLEDARAAIAAGADALGFIFASSPRQVDPARVSEIVGQLPPFVSKVGVFVDADFKEITRIMTECHLDLAQLHGEESPDLCLKLFPRAIKSFRIKGREVLEHLPHYRASAYLLDGFSHRAAGGTGTTFDWDIAREAKRYGNIILSGGLTPQNVHQAVAAVQPFAVDVSSGVEASPGKKDRRRLRDFIRAAQAATEGSEE
ncbi:MAG: trpF [Dehalococcoidia bacterium]|nr:trpF [Dehalococcoidia bacterium]